MKRLLVVSMIAWGGFGQTIQVHGHRGARAMRPENTLPAFEDRKSTRLNSSHRCISYAVFCLKKKKRERFPTASARRSGKAISPVSPCATKVLKSFFFSDPAASELPPFPLPTVLQS